MIITNIKTDNFLAKSLCCRCCLLHLRPLGKDVRTLGAMKCMCVIVLEPGQLEPKSLVDIMTSIETSMKSLRDVEATSMTCIRGAMKSLRDAYENLEDIYLILMKSLRDANEILKENC